MSISRGTGLRRIRSLRSNVFRELVVPAVRDIQMIGLAGIQLFVLSLVIPAQAGIFCLCSPARHSRAGGLLRPEAEANIRVANGPKGEPRMRRVNPVLAFDCFGFHQEQRLPLALQASGFLSLLVQRKEPKKHAPAPCAVRAPARTVRVSGRVPLIAHPVQQRNRRDPSRRPLRGLIARCRRKAMGPPGRAKARASCAQKRKA